MKFKEQASVVLHSNGFYHDIKLVYDKPIHQNEVDIKYSILPDRPLFVTEYLVLFENKNTLTDQEL